ncbi:hypothetical protein IB643_01870 [Allofrancisella guangzhouensis]|nr:hypothetical protein [Allofrancisella guangzhouensis]MBK2026904.1 hypothetical protein [Allofrancisella guangzhouensis]
MKLVFMVYPCDVEQASKKSDFDLENEKIKRDFNLQVKTLGNYEYKLNKQTNEDRLGMWFSANSLDMCKKKIDEFIEVNKSKLFEKKGLTYSLKKIDISVIFVGHGLPTKRTMSFFNERIDWDVIGRMLSYILSLGGNRIASLDDGKNSVKFLHCFGAAPRMTESLFNNSDSKMKKYVKNDFPGEVPIYEFIFPYIDGIKIKITSFFSAAIINSNTSKFSAQGIYGFYEEKNIKPLICNVDENKNITFLYGKKQISKLDTEDINNLSIMMRPLEKYFEVNFEAIYNNKTHSDLVKMWEKIINYISLGEFRLAMTLVQNLNDMIYTKQI